MRKFIKSNIKELIAFLIGLTIAGTTVYAATILSSSDVSYSNTSSGLTSTNVQGAIDEIYNKSKPTKFKIGDYVSMTPTKTTFTVPMTLTGYDSNQTINPSELKLWRVIRINSDNTVDMVSEYVSSVDVYFKGQTGYQNLIGTLNYIAKQYENQKYTSGSRHMGYSNQTEYITDTTALTSTTAPQTASTLSSNVTSATEAKGLGDMGYETDYNLVKTALGTTEAYVVGTKGSGYYWLASRAYRYGFSTDWDFNYRSIDASGSLNEYNALYYYGFDRFYTNSNSEAVRPIVTLKSGVKASSGNGSSSSPYVLP